MLGALHIGPDTLYFRRTDNRYDGMLNGCSLTESDTLKKFSSRSIPVLSLIAINLGKNFGIKGWKTADSLLDPLLDEIKKHVVDVEVQVLDAAPDEITDNTPKEMKTAKILNGVAEYRNSLDGFKEVLIDTRRQAEILLKTKLPSSMWGEKKVAVVLSSVKAELLPIGQWENDLDIIMESSDRKSWATLSRLSKTAGLSKSMVKQAVGETATDVVDKFMQIKKGMSVLAETLYRLSSIDGVFKTSTGYPATWFFDSSVFYDFLYNYENLVASLIKTARIESSTMVPLGWFR
jgi:hypothetical protein